MNLDRVTITGADDSIDHEALMPLSAEFPFVEWGILLSKSSMGGSRFPSEAWLRRLAADDRDRSSPLTLSAHLCGRWVQQLLHGFDEFDCIVGDFIRACERIQLNFHAENTPCNPAACANALKMLGQKQFIFQIDGNGGNDHLHAVNDAADCANIHIDTVGLFDLSGGDGIVPAEWPKPFFIHVDPGEHGDGVESFAYHGYAGGLGPENLERELERIAAAAGDCRIWIDMETRVRSHGDKQFDLAKVRRCLEICEPFIAKATM